MSNKIFLDSSILVEYDKNTKTSLLNSFLEDENTECFISETVVSEFLFHYIKFVTGKAPLTIKSAKQIPAVFKSSKGYMLIQLFSFTGKRRCF